MEKNDKRLNRCAHVVTLRKMKDEPYASSRAAKRMG